MNVIIVFHRRFLNATAKALVAGLLVGLPAKGLCLDKPATSESLEHQVKAAYIFNFARFVQWPVQVPLSDPHEKPLTVGVLGTDKLSRIMKTTLEGRKVEGRTIVVNHVESLETAHQVDILYLARSEKSRLPAVLDAVKGRSVLTVSEIQDFTQHGGMIHLFLKKSKVHFTVNLPAVQSAGLNVSSQMLQYAQGAQE